MPTQKHADTALLKAHATINEGTLVDIKQTRNGHYCLIFKDGQSRIMPANWRVPFDLTVGMKIKIGYDNGHIEF